MRGFSKQVIGLMAIFCIALLGIAGAQIATTKIPASVPASKHRPEIETSQLQTNSEPPVDTSVEQSPEEETSQLETNAEPPVDTSVALMPRPARTLEEFVDQSEVFVIGRISSFSQEGFEGPYSTSAVPDSRADIPPMPKFPFSDFDLEIIDIIANPANIQLPTTVLIRSGGLFSRRDEKKDPPSYQVGDQFFYALVRNPDGSFGTSFGSWGRLNIDGDVVTFANRARTPINFTDRTLPEDFINALKEEAAK